MRWEQLGGAADKEPSSATLARLIRDGRQAVGLTQLQLASVAGVSVGVIRDLEQGRTERPRRQSVARIAAALGIAPGRDEPHSEPHNGLFATADGADGQPVPGPAEATGETGPAAFPDQGAGPRARRI